MIDYEKIYHKSDDFLERAELMQQLIEHKSTSAIPFLFNCIAESDLEESMKVLVEATLTTLIKYEPKSLLNGINHSSIYVQSFCVPLVSMFDVTEAAQDLIAVLDGAADNVLISLILDALGSIMQKEDANILLNYLCHSDPIIASAAATALNRVDVDLFFSKLQSVFAEMDEITALSVLSSLADRADSETVAFLTDNLHHQNSVIRRVVFDRLVSLGNQVSAKVENKLSLGSRNEKLIAVAVLSEIQNQHSVSCLIEATKSEDALVRFAAFEALSKISGPEASGACIGGLFDEQPEVRLAAIAALEANLSPEIVGKIRKEMMSPEKAGAFIQSMTEFAAPRLFQQFSDQRDFIEEVYSRVVSNQNSDLITVYGQVISESANPEIHSLLNKYPVDTKPQDEEKTAGKSVLVVDDSAITQRIMKNHLSKAGCKVVVAGDGVEALAKLDKQSFDLVVTDMNMPRMNGIELVRAIREHILYSDMKVIMISSEDDAEQQQAAKDAGVNDFIIKPIKEEHVRKLLNPDKDMRG